MHTESLDLDIAALILRRPRLLLASPVRQCRFPAGVSPAEVVQQSYYNSRTGSVPIIREGDQPLICEVVGLLGFQVRSAQSPKRLRNVAGQNLEPLSQRARNNLVIAESQAR